MARSSTQRLAKLTQPKLRSALSRTGLFSAREEARQGSLVWVSGPPGAGETRLISSYLDWTRARAVWYQVDAGDVDAASFFYFLSLAAPRGKRDQALPLLLPEYAHDLSAFSRPFLQAMFRRFRSAGCIVLDNDQEVPYGKLAPILKRAVAYAPPGINLIVISRTSPPTPLARERAGERLAEFSWEDLRLGECQGVRIVALKDYLDSR